MSDKPPVSIMDLVERVERERDALREQLLNREAEVESLERERAGDDMAISDLRGEIERLRTNLGIYGNYESAEQGVNALVRERDALRASTEALLVLNQEYAVKVETAMRERDALRAENEELRRQNEWLRRNILAESVNMNNWQVRYREWREAGMPDESSQS